jgi:mono/diheme cytochrome c family protein
MGGKQRQSNAVGMAAMRVLAVGLLAGAALLPAACGDDESGNVNDPATIAQGKETFRNDTFGDEAFWTDMLQMHTVISTMVSPTMALAVGLKVDAEALPPGILGTVDLNSPATTVALLKLNAVLGIKGEVVAGAAGDTLMRVGITCGLCHSSVDDSVMPGIGRRVDGAPNVDLNPGAIIALSPALTAEQKAVYNSWGKGKYDPRYNIDGMSFPVDIPPAYGLKDSPHATFTGDGDIRYWNSYVAVTQMGGQGTFVDDRIGVNKTLPAGTPDLVQPKLDGLRAYQFSLGVPDSMPILEKTPVTGDIGRGKTVFDQRCASCHQGDARTEDTLHAPADTGMDATTANRSASKMYRTTPLRGLAQHPPYFHDGSATTLPAVVDHYDQALGLSLSAGDKADLIAYLKSI